MSRFAFKLLFFITLLLSSAYCQSTNVPLDYWGYEILERWSTKGIIRSFDLFTRPMSRKIFTNLLEEIDSKHQKDSDLLSVAEQQLLEQLLFDFNLGKERHLYTITEPHGTLHVDLYGESSIGLKRGSAFQSDSLRSSWTLGGIVRGQLGNAIGFYLDASNTMTRGDDEIQDSDEQFDPSQGSPVVISGKNVYNDRAIAYFVAEKPWIHFQIGQDEFSWGPNFHHGLTLNVQTQPTGMVGLSIPFSRFKFSYLHAFLKSGFQSKYLAAHRLDLKLLKNLFVAGTETVIYGNRDVELAYLNPLMPFHIAEHHLGDRDNNNLSFDVVYYPARNFKLWIEYFIDDMTTTKSLTSYFGNKFAFQTGLQWVNPAGIPNSQIDLEWVHIEPYVYTHWDSVNIYTHYNNIIGSYLGPNSESVMISWDQWVGRDLKINVFLRYIRKGEGNADTISRPLTGESKSFLQGIVEKRSSIGLVIREQIRRDVFIGLEYFYSDIKNFNHTAGRHSFSHNSRFTVQFNY